MCTPANTPATPPNFPETLLAFSKMSASDGKVGLSSSSSSNSTSIMYPSSNLMPTNNNNVNRVQLHHQLHNSPHITTSNLVLNSGQSANQR